MNALAQIRGGTVYTQSARFDHAQRFLTEDEIRQFAPSVFATTAHESRSARFAPIPTIDVLRALDGEGFGVVGAVQSTAKAIDRAPFAKHLLRLRKRDGQDRKVGDTVFEILLRNANDGSAAYDLLSGLFRIRCLNSLVAMATQLETCRVRHSGDVTGKVIDATYRVIQDAERALVAPDQWSRITLQPEEQQVFAQAAHTARFADAEGVVTTAVTPAQLLEVRRTGDAANDLWTVFNRVQENAIRGGVHAIGRNAAGQRRRSTTREIKGIDQSTSLNRALFTLGEEMARLKAA